ncbi:transglutaminaseTgpA domain-containing protein [Halomonas sp. 1390]|uniref:transglutaminase family protein n=1 Tax=Halomonas sp. B23F22_3 TaxID=3459516 RepID=UPI00373F25EC
MSASRSALSEHRARLAEERRLDGGLLRELFIGQCLVLALHLAWMPAWLVALALAVGGYRWLQWRRGWPRVGVLTRIAAVGGLVLALRAEYGTLGSMDGLIGLLLGVYLLKLLETQDRRDARVVVMIGLIATAVAFLHDQGIPMAAAALLAFAWLLQSLVRLAGSRDRRQAWREAAWLLALSAPLMALLFVTFPRLGPLWSMPRLDRASTGLSDQIAPGDIAELSRSAGRAFRARFEGPEPAPEERYWRVYTLSHFDGIRWSRASPEQLAATLERPVEAFVGVGARSPWQAPARARFRAELLLEPDSRPWRPSLGAPLATGEPQRYLADGTLEGLAALSSRGLLRLDSSGAAPAYPDPAGSRWHRLLPVESNPRTRALVGRLWRASGGDPDAYLVAMMARFGEAPYRYTLSPPRLAGEDRVDDFLFDSRAGYCSHYASAAAVMARMAGIPARVVAGFLGGERHPDGYYTVRDYDAHAWVEVWRQGGWQRLDPTAVIAPERIEQGPQAIEEGAEAFMADARFSALRLREVGWANRLRLGWERLEYRWQLGVIGFQRESRRSLLARLADGWRAAWARLEAWLPGHGLLATTLGLAAVLLMAAGVALLACLGVRRWRLQRDERRLVGALQAWLAGRGLAALPGESPAAHLRRIAPLAGPAGRALADCAHDLERLAYAPLEAPERAVRRRRLARRVAEVRRRLPKPRRGGSGAGARETGVSS